MARPTRWIGWALAVSLAMAAAPGTRGDEEKVSGDLRAMQGDWVPDSDDAPPSHWEIKGRTLRTKVKEEDYESRIALKEQERPHRAVDFEVVKGPEDARGKTVPGIYKLDGDRLTFCIALPGRDVRPTAFKSVQDEQVLIKLKRR